MRKLYFIKQHKRKCRLICNNSTILQHKIDKDVQIAERSNTLYPIPLKMTESEGAQASDSPTKIFEISMQCNCDTSKYKNDGSRLTRTIVYRNMETCLPERDYLSKRYRITNFKSIRRRTCTTLGNKCGRESNLDDIYSSKAER